MKRTLSHILTSEGRVVRDDHGNFDYYEYNLKDHLGNTRVVFTEDDGVIKNNDYYPFGMLMGGTNIDAQPVDGDNKFLYNGKEYINNTDLNLSWYDYGARFYDPQLGRWNSIDPLMKWHFNTTPYNYCFNNPINYIDPFGMDTVYVSDPDKQISEIVITAKKIKKNWFQRAWNWLKNSDSGDGGAEEIIPESLMGDSEYNQMIGTGMQHPGTNSSLNKKGTGTEEDLSPLGPSPNNIGNLFDIVKALGVEGKTDQKTTDKEIVETKTGTGEKTDANGKPVKKVKNDYIDTKCYIGTWRLGERPPDSILIRKKEGDAGGRDITPGNW